MMRGHGVIIILGQTFVDLWFFLHDTLVGPTFCVTIFFRTNIFGPNFFGTHFLDQNLFIFPNIFWNLILFWTNKFSELNFFFDPHFFRSEFIFRPYIFGPKFCLGPICFWPNFFKSNFFQIKHFLGPTFTVDLKSLTFYQKEKFVGILKCGSAQPNLFYWFFSLCFRPFRLVWGALIWSLFCY